MKLVLLAFFLPIAASAMQITDVRLVRQFNGHNLQCKETQELGHDSYFAALDSASANDEAATFAFAIQFKLCDGAAGDQHWTSRKPLDDEHHLDVDGNDVRVAFRNPELVFGGNDQQVVSVPNESSQTLRFRFPYDGNLTPEQAADLAAGNPVPLRTELFYRAIGTAYTAREEIPLGYQFGAAYTVFFTLKK